jgi:hypothetical protein
LSPDAVTTPSGGRKEDHPFREPHSPVLTKETAVSTNNSIRIKVESGLFKRGNRYMIRVAYRDAQGRRREMSRTFTSEREAKAALIDARAAAVGLPADVLLERSFAQELATPWVRTFCGVTNSGGQPIMTTDSPSCPSA